MDTRMNLLIERGVKHWNRLHTAVVESSSIETFKRCEEMAGGGMIERWDAIGQVDG